MTKQNVPKNVTNNAPIGVRPSRSLESMLDAGLSRSSFDNVTTHKEMIVNEPLAGSPHRNCSIVPERKSATSRRLPASPRCAASFRESMAGLAGLCVHLSLFHIRFRQTFFNRCDRRHGCAVSGQSLLSRRRKRIAWLYELGMRENRAGDHQRHRKEKRSEERSGDFVQFESIQVRALRLSRIDLAPPRQEAQLFDPAHTGFGRTGETPIREIHNTALKNSQADDRQGIDCRSNWRLSVASLARNGAVGQTIGQALDVRSMVQQWATLYG